ncbi:response regulator [bacterium]|nr:response regulator [bacterium]
MERERPPDALVPATPRPMVSPAASVLIVEDDDTIREALAAYLTRAGFMVSQAENGVRGLDVARERAFDVIVSDVMMPEMNGLAFLEQARIIHPDCAVILITGYADLSVAIEAMKKGAADFVSKPFQFEYLEGVIRGILRKRGADKPETREAISERLEQKVQELSMLQSINELMEDLPGAEDIFANLCDMATKICGAGAAAYYLFDRDTNVFTLHKIHPQLSEIGRPGSIRLPRIVADTLARDRQPLRFAEPAGIDFYRSVVGPAADRPRAVVLAPLFVRDEYFGLLSVEDKIASVAFTEDDVSYIRLFLKKAGMAIENRALYETIYNNLISTLHSLVSTIEAKDPYTRLHSDRVTRLAVMIGEEMGCADEDLESLRFTGMLHDIGKIGVSDAVLQKKGPLTAQEFESIKLHPIIGEKILTPLNMMPHERAVIRNHHERWDGRGYPDGLAGADIPFLTRILCLADAYDAMTSDRVYRSGLPHETAMKEIIDNAWKQFDGNVVNAFLSICKRIPNLKSHLDHVIDPKSAA